MARQPVAQDIEAGKAAREKTRHEIELHRESGSSLQIESIEES